MRARPVARFLIAVAAVLTASAARPPAAPRAPPPPPPPAATPHRESVIEEVTAKQLERTLGDKDFVAVYWYARSCVTCDKVLEELEKIDDDTDTFGVDFVKINDKRLAKQYGITKFPALTYFREKEPIIYDGDLMDEESVLDFLTSLEAMDLPDRIEEVNQKILTKIIEDTEYVAVLFCPDTKSCGPTSNKPECKKCAKALQELENIDDEADQLGIGFVKIHDEDLAEEYSLGELPKLVYYRHQIPIIYEGELSKEEDVLEWLVANKSTGDEEDVIEDVTARTLNTLIGNIDNLVVVFYDHGDEDSMTVLAELEKIDDDCDKHGIQFVKIDDDSAARSFGIDSVPSIVYFEKQIPNVYDGDLENEDEILEWLVGQLEKDEIEDVTDEMLDRLIKEGKTIAVLFYDNNDRKSQRVLNELENIDDECDQLGVVFVKIDNLEEAREYGIEKIPALLYFEKGIPTLYEGNLEDEDKVLDWFKHQAENDEIEDITDEMLDLIIDKMPYVAVLFYDKDQKKSQKVLVELENIDDECDQNDIAFVKIDDDKEAKEYGIDTIPTIVLFEKGIPHIYEGDLMKEDDLLGWLLHQKRHSEIPEITDEMMDKLIDTAEFLAVIFYDKDDKQDIRILNELENIDDELEKEGIVIVRIDNDAEAKQFGIDHLPTLVYFEAKIPAIYEGDLMNEDEVLKWLIEQKNTATIEEVTDEILKDLIEEHEYVVVYFSGKCEEGEECDNILDELENIDDELDEAGIIFVTTEDLVLAKKYGIKTYPTLVFFRNKEPLIYKGDIEDEDEVLSWLTDEDTLEIPGKIEEVNSKMLEKILQENDHVVVFFYEEGDKKSQKILSELENIDDECEEKDIDFVKTSDDGIEKEYDLSVLPALAFYRHKFRTIYEGDLMHEEAILDWVLDLHDSQPDVIESVDRKTLRDLIEDVEHLAVFFYSDDCSTCADILEELETIDDDTDKQGIQFVKSKDSKLASEIGIFSFPALVYYETGVPIMYDGNLKNEKKVLQWLIEQKNNEDERIYKKKHRKLKKKDYESENNNEDNDEDDVDNEDDDYSDDDEDNENIEDENVDDDDEDDEYSDDDEDSENGEDDEDDKNNENDVYDDSEDENTESEDDKDNDNDIDDSNEIDDDENTDVENDSDENEDEENKENRSNIKYNYKVGSNFKKKETPEKRTNANQFNLTREHSKHKEENENDYKYSSIEINYKYYAKKGKQTKNSIANNKNGNPAQINKNNFKTNTKTNTGKSLSDCDNNNDKSKNNKEDSNEDDEDENDNEDNNSDFDYEGLDDDDERSENNDDESDDNIESESDKYSSDKDDDEDDQHDENDSNNSDEEDNDSDDNETDVDENDDNSDSILSQIMRFFTGDGCFYIGLGGKQVTPKIRYEPYQCCPAKVKSPTKVAKATPKPASKNMKKGSGPVLKPLPESAKLKPKRAQDSKGTKALAAKGDKPNRGKKGLFGSGNLLDEHSVLDWMVSQKNDASIEDIDREQLFKYIESKEFLAVVFYKDGDPESPRVLRHVELIDDEAAEYGIKIVQSSDRLMAKKYGFRNPPGITYFRKGKYINYDGDIDDEEEILDWLTNPENMELTDHIERVNKKMFQKIRQTSDYVAVFFYSNDCKQCPRVLAEIEHIDDEADGAGINFVKIDDRQMAKDFGVFALPAVLFFKMGSKEPVIYAGDLYDEQQLLNWLLTQKDPAGDVIEELEGQLLLDMISESNSLAVYFWNKTLCDICNSKAMRKLRAKKDHSHDPLAHADEDRHGDEDGNECEQCSGILEELENIDDDCDRHGIKFVKTQDFSIAESYGVTDFPVLVYFESNIPNVFEGSLAEEEEVLQWLITQKTEDRIELVTRVMLENMVEETQYLAVFFYKLNCNICDEILEGLEKIDDECDVFGIHMVKIQDPQLAKRYSIKTFPAMVYFRNGNPLLFEGDLQNEESVLEWLIDDDNRELADEIESVNDRMLERLLQESPLLVVLFYDDEDCAECDEILEALEQIDGEVDQYGIDFVKIASEEAASKYNIINIPSLVYFRKQTPMLYDGDLHQVDKVLQWLTSQDVFEIKNEIEEVNKKMLDKLLDENEFLAVYFYENSPESKTVLERLEKIDGETDNLDITFVKMEDPRYARKWGVTKLPAIVYFRKRFPSIYRGDVMTEDEVLEWLRKNRFRQPELNIFMYALIAISIAFVMYTAFLLQCFKAPPTLPPPHPKQA